MNSVTRQLALEARRINNIHRKVQYDLTPKLCLVCSFPIRYQYRNLHKFCSAACAKTHIRIVHGVTEEDLVRKCKNCSAPFKVLRNASKQTCCSSICRNETNKISHSSVEYREKQRKLQRQLYEQGITKGWTTNRNFQSSYPERYFSDLLDSKNIPYIREYQVGRYCIDFAFVQDKLALEIDGKQHLEEPQRSSDVRKDRYLTANGWRVFRIPWKSPKYQNNKDIMISLLDQCLLLRNYDTAEYSSG